MASGAVDRVGLGRSMIIDLCLAKKWLSEEGGDPDFHRFTSPPPGGITAGYTMRLTELGEDRKHRSSQDLLSAIRMYKAGDAERGIKWRERFSAVYP
jgi:hypothetical protein